MAPPRMEEEEKKLNEGALWWAATELKEQDWTRGEVGRNKHVVT